jgi:hypothetical protein
LCTEKVSLKRITFFHQNVHRIAAYWNFLVLNLGWIVFKFNLWFFVFKTAKRAL